MRLFLPVTMLALAFASPVYADTGADPLRLVPETADFFIRIEQPRRLIEGPLSNPLVKQLQTLEAVREFYESTNYRRGQQMLAYFEKYLRAGRLDLLDRLAGGGAVVAVKFGPDPAPALLVIQGKDGRLTQRFLTVAVGVLDQELSLQECKRRRNKSSYRVLEPCRVEEG